MPQIKFTDSTLSKLSADKTTWFTDPTVKGLRLCVTKGGVKTWWVSKWDTAAQKTRAVKLAQWAPKATHCRWAKDQLGKVVLDIHDPAAASATVYGWVKHHVGMDLGRNDPSAIVAIRDECFPEFSGRGFEQRLGECRRTVVFQETVQLYSYTDLADHLAKRLHQIPHWTLAIDASGLTNAEITVYRFLTTRHLLQGTAAKHRGRFRLGAKSYHKAFPTFDAPRPNWKNADGAAFRSCRYCWRRNVKHMQREKFGDAANFPKPDVQP